MLCYTRKEPVGVCGQIIPWNFPLLMAAVEDRPGAGGRLHDRAQAGRADAAHRAAPGRARAGGRPARRACSTWSPATARRGAALVEHPGVDKIAFTGSTEVGREIGANAGRALKRVTLELGGKSPNIDPARRRPRGRDQGLATRHVLQLGPGLQRRLAPVRAQGPVRRGRRRRWPRPPQGARSAPASTPPTQLGPLVSAGAARPRARLHRGGPARGRRAGDRRRRADGGDGYFVEPTLFTADPRRPRRSRARRSSGRCSSHCHTRTSMRSPRGPTTRPTGSRPASGRATWARHTSWPRCCRPAPST